MLDRLSQEHAKDESFASEVVESLARVATARNPDMLGYMPNGFFEGCRRNIRWDWRIV